MPLLGPKPRRASSRRWSYGQLVDYWNAHGSAAPARAGGMSIVLDTERAVDRPAPIPADALAAVEIRTLFTALCHLSADGRRLDAARRLDSLATEATSALAAQVNRLVPD